MHIFNPRAFALDAYPDVLSQENTWAFGQVLALLLLALPLIGLYELIYGKAPQKLHPTKEW